MCKEVEEARREGGEKVEGTGAKKIELPEKDEIRSTYCQGRF